MSVLLNDKAPRWTSSFQNSFLQTRIRSKAELIVLAKNFMTKTKIYIYKKQFEFGLRLGKNSLNAVWVRDDLFWRNYTPFYPNRRISFAPFMPAYYYYICINWAVPAPTQKTSTITFELWRDNVSCDDST